MDATQVAPMPVLHSVMMLKVSEASRATSVTRAAAAQAAAQAAASAHRRHSLTLHHHHALHVSAESASSASALHQAAPVTPHASDMASSLSSSSAKCAGDASSPAAVFSPRDPSSKVAATSAPVFAAKPQPLSSSSLKLQSPALVAPSSPLASADSAPSSPEASSPVSKRGQSSTPKSSASPKAMKANTGRWTDAEHKLFLKGLETFPYRAWKKIATLIKTRTVVQIRTHAQKYYQKLEKEEARTKDREHQMGSHHHHAQQQHGFSASLSSASLSSSASSGSLSDASEYSDSSVCTPRASASPAKKKSMLRKRKFTMDDDACLTDCGAMDIDTSSCMATLPSLPKRMMKEKKFPREKHMSPKQKAPVSGSSKFFGASFSSPELGPESAHRAVFGRGGGSVSANKIPAHPLDFDDASGEGMILDFADDKSMAEYPFHLDGGIDHGISSMDNDDLLQLTDEESLDWFSTAGSDQDELLKVEPLGIASASVDNDDTTATSSSSSIDDAMMEISESSPLTLGRYHFSPLYTDECLQFSDAADDSGCSSPSSAMLGGACDAEDFILSGDEDDDFVLDPEKFLSSYFSPSN